MAKVKREIVRRFTHLFQEIKQEIPLVEYIIWWVFRAVLLGGMIWSIFYSPDKIFEMAVSVILTFCIPILHLFCMKLWPGHFPLRMQTVGTVYIFIANFMGSLVGIYYLIPWWDIALHASSGVVLVYVGYCIVVALNHKQRQKFGDPSPIVQATWGAGFSVFVAPVWEIMEFCFDSISHGDSQHWRVNPNPDFEIFHPVTDPAMMDFFHVDAGRYALLDTMTDMACGLIGAVIGFLILLVWLRRRERAGLLQHGPLPAPTAPAAEVQSDESVEALA